MQDGVPEAQAHMPVDQPGSAVEREALWPLLFIALGLVSTLAWNGAVLWALMRMVDVM